jgi:hypothetical protein
VRAGNRAQRVQAVRLHPQVGVGEATAASRCLVEQFESSWHVAAGGRDKSETAARKTFPAWVADLTAERERMLEALRGRVDITRHEVDLRAERLWMQLTRSLCGSSSSR